MRRLVLLAAGVLVLGVLWARVGWRDLADTVRRLDPAWLAAAFATFVPQTLLSGARWALLARPVETLSLGRATAQVLVASSMNVVLPSKMGDVAKGALLRPGASGSVATGLALGVLEKGLDTAALAAWMLGACALSPPSEPLGMGMAAAGAAGLAVFAAMLTRPVAARAARAERPGARGVAAAVRRLVGRTGAAVLVLRDRPGRFATILLASVVLWGLHLLQLSFVHRAAAGTAPEAVLWRGVPMAIFVGLLPVTFAGVGTRDAAMAYFLARPAGEGPALALGAFATVRYLVPALAGLAFLSRVRRAPAPPR